MNQYPKWVSRGHGMGEILCLNEAEEQAVLQDNAAREKPAQPVEPEPEKRKPGRPRKD